ncbi:hypothetical protein [Pseudolabrys sp.]|jgi:uncharacterized protein (TIGR00725 family)|uniref:SLOG cluster 4 domain-containing protein n=1 Tax=Pseudolabrys sp. TaxID=1960880 RepID=UPI003D10BEE2
MARSAVIGVMGAGEGARPQDVKTAFELGRSVAREGWVLLSGGRNAGVMDAVSKGAKAEGGLTIGIVPEANKNTLSDAVDVGIVTGMGSARNNINVLSSDVVVACGFGGSGTASEIALALKSGKSVILLNNRAESREFFATLGGSLVHAAETVEDAVAAIRRLLNAA